MECADWFCSNTNSASDVKGAWGSVPKPLLDSICLSLNN